MFKRILVPLDGSRRAESAIPVASRLAQAAGGTIILLRVLSSVNELWPQMPPELSDASETERYLDGLKHSAYLKGLTTETLLLTGYPADIIVAVAEEHHADLIVLCRHGETGFTRWVMGSVAQKVARSSTIPVCILREDNSGIPVTFPDRDRTFRVLVALDGSSFAERMLAPAVQLVAGLSSPVTPGVLHLMQVVKLPSEQEERIYQHYDVNIREYNRHEAENYLRTVKAQADKMVENMPGVQITASVIEDRDIAGALIRTAEPTPERTDYDLIALATHGRGGLQRWMVGSVAERILTGTQLPLLLVRPQEVAKPLQAQERKIDQPVL
jgi:nucleotide-binding universal stress UspA family protein